METYNSFRKLAEDLKKRISDNEKFFVLALAERMTKVASENPQDATIVQMASFLTAKAENPQNILITKRELTDVYKALYSHNTKCASYMANELDEEVTPKLSTAKYAEKLPNEGIAYDVKPVVDEALVAGLSAVFAGKEVEASPALVKKAETICGTILPGKPTVKAIGSREFAVICQASYQTPKGTAHVLVPVEVSGNQALLPTTFLSHSGFESLANEKALEKHLITVAGRAFRVDADKLFNQIKVAKFGPTTDSLDDVEMAVISLRAKTASVTETDNGIEYKDIFAKEVERKEIKQPVNASVMKAFASEMEATAGMAEFVFGKKVVDFGRTIIAKELGGCNVRNAQVKVSNYDDDRITYTVVAGTKGFKVNLPVKKASSGEYVAEYPSMIITDGGIESFDREGISQAIKSASYSVASEVVGISGKSPSELIDEVEKSCIAGDFNRASLALINLQETGDSGSFKYAFDMFNEAMSGIKKEASARPQMKTVKIGGNLVEATTGLPVDKVYVDENGIVRAKHNKHFEKSSDYQSNVLINTKIYGAMS